MQDKATRKVGPVLHLVGLVSRNTPYFRGKWRLIDRIFHRYFRGKNHVEIVRINSNLEMQCKLWDEVQNNIWWCGDAFENNQVAFLKSALRPGMTFLDVGANVGYYSLLASPIIGSSGQIHAFEPVTQQFSDFQQNITRNDLKNIVANKLIVSERSGTMTIHLGEEYNSGASSVAYVPTVGNRFEVVEAVSIDDYIEKRHLQKVDVIKVDVEGHELSVFKGAEKMLRTQKPIVLAEIVQWALKKAGSSREGVYSFLHDLGYQSYAIRSGGVLEKLEKPEDGLLIVFKAT